MLAIRMAYSGLMINNEAWCRPTYIFELTSIGVIFVITSTLMNFSATEWQKETYLNGFAGIRSKISVDIHKLEEAAKAIMSPKAFAYIAGGAGRESTMLANRNAFEKFKIIPRMLLN